MDFSSEYFVHLSQHLRKRMPTWSLCEIAKPNGNPVVVMMGGATVVIVRIVSIYLRACVNVDIFSLKVLF
jgi:hypothetical protein